MQIIHDGQVVRTIPLRSRVDHNTSATPLAAEVKWEGATPSTWAKTRVRFMVKIGSQDLTSTGEFTRTQS
jgi:hypothetical protein